MIAELASPETVVVDANGLVPGLRWLRHGARISSVPSEAEGSIELLEHRLNERLRAYCSSTPLRPGAVALLTRLRPCDVTVVVWDVPSAAIRIALARAGLGHIRTEAFGYDGCVLADPPAVEQVCAWLRRIALGRRVAGVMAVSQPLIAATLASELRLLPWPTFPPIKRLEESS